MGVVYGYLDLSQKTSATDCSTNSTKSGSSEKLCALKGRDLAHNPAVLHPFMTPININKVRKPAIFRLIQDTSVTGLSLIDSCNL